MTQLLEQAFKKCESYPHKVQNVIASMLLELDFDYSDSNYGPIFSLNQDSVVKLGITSEEVEMIGEELGIK